MSAFSLSTNVNASNGGELAHLHLAGGWNTKPCGTPPIQTGGKRAFHMALMCLRNHCVAPVVMKLSQHRGEEKENRKTPEIESTAEPHQERLVSKRNSQNVTNCSSSRSSGRSEDRPDFPDHGGDLGAKCFCREAAKHLKTTLNASPIHATRARAVRLALLYITDLRNADAPTGVARLCC